VEDDMKKGVDDGMKKGIDERRGGVWKSREAGF
jgi:hypothetical protein